MATAARLAFAAWRNEICTRTIRVVGLDLTDASYGFQVRNQPDTPGAALIDLAKVDAGMEGISFVGVETVDNMPTTTLTLRINKNTLQSLPYSGELGANTVLSYAFQFGSKTRLFGDFVVLASTYGSDSAPTQRDAGPSTTSSAALWGSATLTFDRGDIAITIDGAAELGGLIGAARDAADQATAAAEQADVRTGVLSQKLLQSYAPNLYPHPELNNLTTGDEVTWNNVNKPLIAEEKNGALALKTPAGTPAFQLVDPVHIDVADLPSGAFSASVVIRAKDVTAAAEDLRIRIQAVDADGNTITATDLWSAEGNDDTGGSRATYYTRYLPAEALDAPWPLIIAENVPVPAGAVALRLTMRVEATAHAWLSHFNFRDGLDPAFVPARQTTMPQPSPDSVAYVSTAGSDTASGAIDAPVKTLQAAINAIGGSGSIYIANGTYATPQVIDPATVTGYVRIIGKRAAAPAYDQYPVLYCAAPLTGITKTSGRTKVYQAAVAGLPANADFSWAYQAGVADPRTLIERAFPEHRGRTHRLPDCAKLLKTEATVLTDALAEIDASDDNDPRAFIDDSTGTLYFAIVGGGDGTAASIYLDSATGLIGAATRESAGTIEMQGIDVRFGGLDLTPFRRAHLDEARVIGSRVNAVDYSVLSFGTLEVACAGSATGSTGDGLNGHRGAKMLAGSSLWSHDNNDDGWSDHEGASSRFGGTGLCEYNGGTAVCPAVGSDSVIANIVSYRNQRAGLKYAAFLVIGPPGQSAAPDDGTDTNARFVNCVSIKDVVGFGSSGTSAFAACHGCKVYQSGDYGYSGGGVTIYGDCEWTSATGAARHANTTLIASARIAA